MKFFCLQLCFEQFWLILYSSASPEPFDTDKMAMEFSMQFVQKAFTEGQSLAFSFAEKKLLSVCVKSIEGWSFRLPRPIL